MDVNYGCLEKCDKKYWLMTEERADGQTKVNQYNCPPLLRSGRIKVHELCAEKWGYDSTLSRIIPGKSLTDHGLNAIQFICFKIQPAWLSRYRTRLENMRSPVRSSARPRIDDSHRYRIHSRQDSVPSHRCPLF